MPLGHPPGHAQADFGEAWAVIGGVRRKIHFLVVDLPQSDAIFVKAYPAETAEAFCDGHVAAFDFFGGVPLSILYDNTRLAITDSVRHIAEATDAIDQVDPELTLHGLLAIYRSNRKPEA